METKIRVNFFHSDLIQKFCDGSELFKCSITGPENISDFTTGESRFSTNGVPELRLCHHTSDDVLPLIMKSGHFRGSVWNIQGNKELENVNYVYFTPLDKITQLEDLVQIAMAQNGKIWMSRDGFDMPQGIDIDTWREKYGEDILEIEVYRESTANRTASLGFFVRADCLASQHLLFHQSPGDPCYYEVCKPFIHRVGIIPGEVLPFDFDTQSVNPGKVLYFDHLIAGDATRLSGLLAPFDEENTNDIFKVERTPEDHSMVSFWFSFGNQDHFSGKSIEPYRFKKDSRIEESEC